MNTTQFTHANGLTVEQAGQGPRIVLVHGGGLGGALAWKAQLPWADQFHLIMPYRAAYGPRPLTDREDFEQDAVLIADLLDGGAHLIGHSYGGVTALLAAARRPESVRSLTLIEPGATSVARDNPAVRELERALVVLAANPPADPEMHLRTLISILDPSGRLPTPLPPPLLAFAQRLKRLRSTNEAVIPLTVLRQYAIPSLVISGGHSPVFDAIAEVLARELSAQIAAFPGLGHVPHWHSDAVNRRILAFLAAST